MDEVFAYMIIGWLTVWLVDWMARYMGDDSLAANDDGFIMFIVTLWPIVLVVVFFYGIYLGVTKLVKLIKGRN